MSQMPPRGSARAARLRSAAHVAALKWAAVVVALLIATVIDGKAVFDMSKPAVDATATSKQVGITLPSDRCGPGCAIMVAANQTGDAFNLRLQD